MFHLVKSDSGTFSGVIQNIFALYLDEGKNVKASKLSAQYINKSFTQAKKMESIPTRDVRIHKVTCVDRRRIYSDGFKGIHHFAVVVVGKTTVFAGTPRKPSLILRPSHEGTSPPSDEEKEVRAAKGVSWGSGKNEGGQLLTPDPPHGTWRSHL